jgi:hypothetical protein
MNKNHSKNVLQLVHVDLGGPILKETLDLSKYFLVFIDDYSCKSWVYFLCAKSETFANFFSRFSRSWVKCEIGKKIGALKNNCGGEVAFTTFNDYCQTHGIKRQLTNPSFDSTT